MKKSHFTSVLALRHKKTLGYPVCDKPLPTVPEFIPLTTTVVTFASPNDLGCTLREVSALDRLLDIPVGDVIISYFDESPLYASFVWDIAYSLSVGHYLYLNNSENAAELLKRSWYKNSFSECESMDASYRVFKKVAPLLIECEKGLDEWSFCIPTGGESKNLNACVERILTLNIPKFEILVCGNPDDNFLYSDKVKIIDGESNNSKGKITYKKNLMVSAARYNNLCVLHDRVMLPLNFHEAVERFGDGYPLTCFQSFWFSDLWLAVPRRYSDFGSAGTLPTQLISPLTQRPSRQSIEYFDRLECMAQHPERCEFGRDFVTGSLYLSKKSVWQVTKQNEQYSWAEFEDIEFGIYAASLGIPSRVNPYAITKTLSYRSIMHVFGRSIGCNNQGNKIEQRSLTELLGFPRRPHLNVTENYCEKMLFEFSIKYIGNTALVEQCGKKMTGFKRYTLICQLLWAAQGDLRELPQDWFKYILLEEPTNIELDRLRALQNQAVPASVWKIQWLSHPILVRQVYNNPFSSPFVTVFEPRSRFRFLGSLLSAMWLKFFSKHSAIRLSLFQLWKSILS